ncbi:MAG: allantoicase [Phycisphaeraceae bacterium]|nr:allantoicase [Phycisphaeraceae bacterium]
MGQAIAGVADFSDLIDLASARMGGKALIASDEFFAGKENLLKPGRAIWIADKYTEFGKWMDGWESRRKRVAGHDWCIIALGRPGIIRGVNVDTGHFKGNQPESCTVEAVEIDGDPGVDRLLSPDTRWVQVTDRATLNPDSEHLIPANDAAGGKRFTHVRLNIFPDGGVARFRVHGTVLPDWQALRGKVVDLAGAENGALVIACNDMHFGSRHNLIMPGRSANMGDGWETRRKRGLKGGEFDWCIVQLGHRGRVQKVEVDTNHFKGNFPESCEIEICDARAGDAFDPALQQWETLLPRTKLRASEQHFYESELRAAGKSCTHARLKIFPDGGISRLRLFGITE